MVSENPLLKCQSMMVTKILLSVLSSNESSVISSVCRVSRVVIRLEPPPGGSMADTNNYNTRTHLKITLIYKNHHYISFKTLLDNCETLQARGFN